MTAIRFYHLQRTELERALPILLERSLSRGQRSIVRCPDSARVERLAEKLWTVRADSFLPHGSAEDGHGADQPIWLTQGDDNPNGAELLFLTDGVEPADFTGLTLVCTLFDGRDPTAVALARQQWKRWKDAGHDLEYWQQTESGWQKK